jgi:hypothetical protein
VIVISVLLGVSQSRPCIDVIRLEEVFHLRSDTFEPLASFGELVDVQIEPCSSTGLTDASLLKMAKSWPKLYKLSLYEATINEDPKTTFFGFQSLIAYRPQLTYLTLRNDSIFLTMWWRLSCWRNTPKCTHVHLAYCER